MQTMRLSGEVKVNEFGEMGVDTSLGAKALSYQAFAMGSGVTKLKVSNTVLFHGRSAKFLFLSPEKPVYAYLANATGAAVVVTGPFVMEPRLTTATDAFYLKNASTYSSGNTVHIWIAD